MSVLDERKALCYVPKVTIVNLIPIIKRICVINVLRSKKKFKNEKKIF